jgi:transcriptional regulator with XRE-family HTH domain
VRAPGEQPGRRRRTFHDSRLQQWLNAHGFSSAELERATGMSRQSTTQIRGGRDLRLTTMLRILRGCRALASRKVVMDEIFDLDPDSPSNALQPHRPLPT